MWVATRTGYPSRPASSKESGLLAAIRMGGWGPLHRFGYETDIVRVEKAAVEGEPVVDEGAAQIVECLDHAIPALGEGDTEAGEVFGL